MFDALVQELGSRFDLGGRAGALVRSVLTYLFQEESGGLNAFLDRFRKGGLGDLVGSWVGNPAPRELTAGQLEGVLGGRLLEQMASQAGLSASKATPALGLLLPKLVGMLTADGRVPTGVPAGVAGWLGDTGRAVGTYQAEGAREHVGTYQEEASQGRVGTYQGEAVQGRVGTYQGETVQGRVGTYRAEPAPAPVAPARSMWPWVIPLLAAGALALIWALWPTSRAVSPPATTQLPVPSPPAVTAPSPPAVTAPSPPAVTAPAVTAPSPPAVAAPPAPTTTSAPPAIAEIWPIKVYFATGSTVIRGADSARIQRAAAYLKANPGTVVNITGFADKTGAPASNEILATDRAKVVRGALIAAGVVESRANLAPAASVTPPGTDAEARRAEIRPQR